MAAPGIRTVATLGVLALCAGIPGTTAGPGYQAVPDLSQSGLPDQAAAQQLLRQFRDAINAQPYYLEFDLHCLPRRGPERVYQGRLWGAQTSRGPISRFSLAGPDGHEHRLLVQNGLHPAVWSWEGSGVASPDPGALFSPLFPGLEMTAFDLQMPFLYWPDAKVFSLDRVQGRLAYGFRLRPPPEFAAAHPGITEVRAYLDTQYNALVESQIIGSDGQVVKTMSLIDLKRLGERWIVKDIDIRNEATRDKTRFSATAATLGSRFDPSLFEPGQLSQAAAPPDRIVRFSP